MQATTSPLSSDEQEQETIKTYDRYAAEWAHEHSNRRAVGLGGVVEELQKVLPGGKILEVGAGGGSDGALLKEAGYAYVGTDASAGMVKAARETNPDLQFEQRSVYDLQGFSGQFDGFWASAVLLHIPKERIDEALQNIAAVVKPGGYGFISMKDGDRTEFEQREKLGRQEDRLFVYWPKEAFEKTLARNGFKVVWYEYQPMSERTNWHLFIVQNKSL